MPSRLPNLVESALTGAESSYSKTTIRSYRAAWRDLLKWWSGEGDADIWASRLEKEGSPLLPPEGISEYLLGQQDMSQSTLEGRRQAIRLVYDYHDLPDPFEQPTVRKAWAEARRKKQEEGSSSGSARTSYGPAEVIENGLDLLEGHFASGRGRKDVVEEERFRKDVQYLSQEVSSAADLDQDQRRLIPEPTFDRTTMRNRALLLLVATTSATRSKIVGIEVEDIHLSSRNVFLESEVSKTRETPLQVGLRNAEGSLKSLLHLRLEPKLRYCPPRAVASWIVLAELDEGRLFRSLTPQGKPKASGIQPQAINHVIRRRAEEVENLDPSGWTTRRLRSR